MKSPIVKYFYRFQTYFCFILPIKNVNVRRWVIFRIQPDIVPILFSIQQCW